MENKIIKIGGMTCINCKKAIENGLGNITGVESVSVNYKTGKCEITIDTGLVGWKDIFNAIEDLGYTIGNNKKTDLINIVSIGVIIVSLYYFLEQTGLLNLLNFEKVADSTMGFGMLFVIGLMTSVHCIAMCGGINVSQCLSENKKFSGLSPVMYNLGRVVSYTVIGFVLGFAGMFFGTGENLGVSSIIQGLIKSFAGIYMVIMGVNMLGFVPQIKRLTFHLPNFIGKFRVKNSQPFVVGLLNGFMPCGPLQSIQLVALATGNPFTGGLSMFAFSLGTVPLMLGLGSLVSVLGKRFTDRMMTVGAVLVTVMGLAMVSQGASLTGMIKSENLMVLVVMLAFMCIVENINFNKRQVKTVSLMIILFIGIFTSRFTAINYVSENDESSYHMENGVQVVESQLASGKYPSIKVKKDVPVRWIINAPDGSINGCNYKIYINSYGIEHTFQKGENIIEFTPTKSESIGYSCWMGMIKGNINVVE